MKVCKKYQELVLMYQFNPISDILLFENIQTQHILRKKMFKRRKKECINIFIGLKMIN